VRIDRHRNVCADGCSCSTDFENKFVCGEIMTYEDLKEHGSEAAVKAGGKVRQQGKPYVMVDGDIAYWKVGQ
jgi:obg-like ATPase 1